jgi:hypothetical protein
VLAKYADTIAKEGGMKVVTHLHGTAATIIQANLNTHQTVAVFFFLHGRKQPFGVVDGNGASVIDQATVNLLSSRTVCGTCYSLNSLADQVVHLGGTVIGYDGEWAVPMTPRHAAEMEQAALAAHRLLLAGGTVRDAIAEAENCYRKMARAWFGRNTLTDMVLAAGVAEANANAVGAKGNLLTRL